MDIFSLLITRPMGYIIEFVYTLIPNYGVAIILFTLLIKALLFPLNYKSQKSIIRQQRLQPLLQEIQTKYANDKEKQSMETMLPAIKYSPVRKDIAFIRSGNKGKNAMNTLFSPVAT